MDESVPERRRSERVKARPATIRSSAADAGSVSSL